MPENSVAGAGIPIPIRLEIVTTNGRSQMVDAMELDGYAFHRQLFGDGWAITHLASKLMIWRVRHETEATAVLFWLAGNSPLPRSANDVALRAWAAAHRLEHEGMRALMQNIAPLWPRSLQ